MTLRWSSTPKMDYAGNDISSNPSISLENCKKNCVEDKTCKGIETDFDGPGPGHCWVKSSFQNGKSNDNRWAYMLNR